MRLNACGFALPETWAYVTVLIVGVSACRGRRTLALWAPTHSFRSVLTWEALNRPVCFKSFEKLQGLICRMRSDPKTGSRRRREALRFCLQLDIVRFLFEKHVDKTGLHCKEKPVKNHFPDRSDVEKQW